MYGAIVIGESSAYCASCRNSCNWRRDRASAIPLSTPGTCSAWNKTLYFMQSLTNSLTRHIIFLFVDFNLFKINVSAWLSVKIVICLLLICGPMSPQTRQLGIIPVMLCYIASNFLAIGRTTIWLRILHHSLKGLCCICIKVKCIVNYPCPVFKECRAVELC